MSPRSNECTSQVHAGGISEHMRDDEIDHIGYTNTNNELLNECVTGNKVENLCSLQFTEQLVAFANFALSLAILRSISDSCVSNSCHF